MVVDTATTSTNTFHSKWRNTVRLKAPIEHHGFALGECAVTKRDEYLRNSVTNATLWHFTFMHAKHMPFDGTLSIKAAWGPSTWQLKRRVHWGGVCIRIQGTGVTAPTSQGCFEVGRLGAPLHWVRRRQEPWVGRLVGWLVSWLIGWLVVLNICSCCCCCCYYYHLVGGFSPFQTH